MNNDNQSAFNIGTLNANGEHVQVGNHDSQNITIQNLAEQVANSDDDEEKGLLKQLLEHNSITDIIDEGISVLLDVISM